MCGLCEWTRESVHSFSFARYKPSKNDICYLCGTNQILKISLMTRPNCVSIIWRMSHSLHVKDNFLSGRWWHVAKRNIPIQIIILDGIVPHTTGSCGGRDLMVVGLQLHVQSVPITTKVVRSNPAQSRRTRYNIM